MAPFGSPHNEDHTFLLSVGGSSVCGNPHNVLGGGLSRTARTEASEADKHGLRTKISRFEKYVACDRSRNQGSLE